MVNIESSKVIQEPVPGQPGKVVDRKIWIGTLFNSDGKTPDGKHEWEESGAFRNQRGVANPNDLAIFVSDLPPLEGEEPTPAEENDVEAILEENAARSFFDGPPIPAPFIPDPRVSHLLPGLIVNCYDFLVAAAAEKGLDVKGRPPMISGPWVEAVGTTLVALLDTTARVQPLADHPPTPPAGLPSPITNSDEPGQEGPDAA
jgi:hypothetical protein